jgi:P-type E1-E2 ATPase
VAHVCTHAVAVAARLPTAICSDKTGTLTQNKMTVVQGSVASMLFRTMDEASTLNVLPNSVLTAVVDGLAINSSAYEGKDDKGAVVRARSTSRYYTAHIRLF